MTTVGENIIGDLKIPNNYGAIELFIFSIAPCKVMALNCLHLYYIFFASLLYFHFYSHHSFSRFKDHTFLFTFRYRL